jgi:D-alanyl-D-alanine-carboxypeptidase/D-alanyl-D-alanine-endopeptidase
MNGRRLIFLCLAWCSLSAAAEPQSLEVRIRELARDWLASNDGVGLSIGIYDGGQRQFFNVGVTQLDGNKTPTKDTVYEIGSLTKTMTGQLLARAVVEGRARLEDEVSRYLVEPYPNLANDGQPVRLLHLVNGTSQLIDNIPDLSQVRLVPGEPLAVTRMRVYEDYTRAEFLRQLQRVMPRAPPGDNPSYSNVASMLLGVVLERIHEAPFEQILAREIEKPLRMASGIAPPARLVARGHTDANELLPPFTAKSQYASLTLRYSTDDLLKYAAWQMVERDASVKLAHQPLWSTPDGRQSVAFHWIVGGSPHGRRLRYAGATFGFTAVCDLYPEAKVAVVLLSNKAADGAQDSLRALSAKILELLRPEPLGVSPPLSSAGALPQAR